MKTPTKAEIFRRAAEAFAGGVARSQPNWNELGDRAFTGILAENNGNREHWIRVRCRDAGWEDE